MLHIETPHAELRNINIGREGSGDGMVTRVDLKFVFPSHASILTQLLELKNTDPSMMFWDEDGEPLVDSVSIDKQFTNNILSFGQESMFNDDDYVVKLAEVTVAKISFSAMPNHLLSIGITAQFRNPTEHQLKLITDLGRMQGILDIQKDPEFVKLAARANPGEQSQDQVDAFMAAVADDAHPKQ